MGQSGSVELTTGHLQNNSGGRICGLIPQASCAGDSHTEKLSKIGLETMSALIRVSDPRIIPEILEQARNLSLSIESWLS